MVGTSRSTVETFETKISEVQFNTLLICEEVIRRLSRVINRVEYYSVKTPQIYKMYVEIVGPADY